MFNNIELVTHYVTYTNIYQGLVNLVAKLGFLVVSVKASSLDTKVLSLTQINLYDAEIGIPLHFP